MTSRAFWLIIASTGCTVPPLDLDAKPCPCLTGYACDAATNTCVRSSCLGVTAGTPLYETAFDDLSGWLHPVGTWSAQAGEAVQSDSTSSFAYAYQPAVTATDYRIVSTFRAIDGVGTSTAVELSARVQLDGSGGQYHCNWDPFNGGFNLMYSSSPAENGFFAQAFPDTSQIPGYDPKGSFTMELQVRGSRLDCCVRGIGVAAGFANDTRFASGAPGMKTFTVAAAYDDYHVFALP